MDASVLVKSMTPQVYERLLQAVETGKWPDGSVLSAQQKESSMQAVMLYQATVLQSEQHMTVGATGDIVHKSKRELKDQFSDTPSETNSATKNHENNTIARFKQDDF